MLLQTITRLPSLRDFRCRGLEDTCAALRRPLAGPPLRSRRPAAAAAGSHEGGSAPPPPPRLKVLRAQAPAARPVTGPPTAAPTLPHRPAVLRVEPEAVAPLVKGQQLLRQADRGTIKPDRCVLLWCSVTDVLQPPWACATWLGSCQGATLCSWHCGFPVWLQGYKLPRHLPLICFTALSGCWL